MEFLMINKNFSSNECNFRKPLYIGSFGVETNSKFERSYHSNAYPFYKLLDLKQFDKDKYLDLNTGYETSIDWPGGTPNYLDDILMWIVQNLKKFSLNNIVKSERLISINTDFVSYRGTLSRIMYMPYVLHEEYNILAQDFKGTIYLHLLKDNDESRFKDEKLRKFCYSGRRFESYCTKNLDNIDEKNLNEFCGVFRSRLNAHSLVYAAEMDCFENLIEEKNLNERIDDNKLKSVELKTTFMPSKDIKLSLRNKSVVWWCQSYLTNTSKILLGVRNEDLIVKKLINLKLDDLIDIGISTKKWNPKVCIQFLDKFLTYVKTSFIKSKENVLKFTRKKNEFFITCKAVDSYFLPKSYVEKFD